MNIYASPTGTDSGVSPLLPTNLQHACDIALPGDTIWRLQGTYPTVDITTSGAPGQYIWMRSYEGDGIAQTIDGTGNVQTLRVQGCSWWRFSDLIITNLGGDGVSVQVNGFYLTSDTGLPNGQGPHDIIVERVTVSHVDRAPLPGTASVPFGIYNPADTTGVGTFAYNIECYDVVEIDCDTNDFPIGPFEGPLGAIAGAVTDCKFERCIFDPYRNGHQGGAFGVSSIEVGPAAGAVPKYPQKIVWIECEFLSGHSGIGLFRASNQLVMACTLSGLDDVNLESNSENEVGPSGPDPVGQNNWFLGCQINDSYVAIATGPWDANWYGTKNFYVTGNRVVSTKLAPALASGQVMFNSNHPGYPSVTGDSRFSENVVKAPNQLLWLPIDLAATYVLDYNAYLTDDPIAFYHPAAWSAFPYSPNYDQHSTLYPYATDVDTLPYFTPAHPSWWDRGYTFGKYEPTEFYSAWGQTFAFPKPMNAETWRVG